MYALAAVVVVGGMIVLAWVLGERTRSSSKGFSVHNQPYESGMLPTGSARLRLTAKFYLIAMFFVVFDLEAVFIFAWVIAFDALAERGLGWVGYAEMAIFIGVLVAGLVYLWRQGALDWGPERRNFGFRISDCKLPTKGASARNQGNPKSEIQNPKSQER